MQHPAPQNTYDANDPFGSMSGGRSYPHTGSDYRIAYGTVESIANAVIYHTGFNSGNGNYVCAYLPGFDWYPDGPKGGTYIAYLHLSEIHVSEGQTLNEGDPIGISGNSGTNSQGPHLHITISNSDMAYLGQGDKIDPYAFIELVRSRAASAPKPVAPKPVAPKPALTEVQKLQAQRDKLAREIALLKKQNKLSTPAGRNLSARLAQIVSRIAALGKKK